MAIVSRRGPWDMGESKVNNTKHRTDPQEHFGSSHNFIGCNLKALGETIGKVEENQ